MYDITWHLLILGCYGSFGYCDTTEALQAGTEQHSDDILTEVVPKDQLLPLSPALLQVDGYYSFTNFDPTQPDLSRNG